MSFYISDKNIRPGIRGGKDKFNWDLVKDMKTKDRDCFLGVSEKLGHRNLGFKWTKNDYISKNLNKSKLTDEDLKRIEAEIKEVKNKEKEALDNIFGTKLDKSNDYSQINNNLNIGNLKESTSLNKKTKKIKKDEDFDLINSFSNDFYSK